MDAVHATSCAVGSKIYSKVKSEFPAHLGRDPASSTLFHINASEPNIGDAVVRALRVDPNRAVDVVDALECLAVDPSTQERAIAEAKQAKLGLPILRASASVWSALGSLLFLDCNLH